MKRSYFEQIEDVAGELRPLDSQDVYQCAKLKTLDYLQRTILQIALAQHVEYADVGMDRASIRGADKIPVRETIETLKQMKNRFKNNWVQHDKLVVLLDDELFVPLLPTYNALSAAVGENDIFIAVKDLSGRILIGDDADALLRKERSAGEILASDMGVALTEDGCAAFKKRTGIDIAASRGR